MRKTVLALLFISILPAGLFAGFSFGLINEVKKKVDKVDAKVAQRKAAILWEQTPSVPASLAAVAVSSTQINLSWTASADDVGVTGYKVYRNGGAAPIAAPTGTTCNNAGLTASGVYSYTVSACDAAGNCSGQSSAVSYTIPPPPTAGGEWAFVPANSSYGITDFYVMKYEAKSVVGVATSQAAVTPWVGISQTAAITACSALGSGYHLLTMPETQTININIEAQTANWADGTIGSLVSAGGGLKRGNVNITDSASYGSGAVDFDAGSGRNAKATHVLSSGGQIWDWSGNVWEWIYGAGAGGTLGTPGGVTFDAGGIWYEWNSASSPDLSQERSVLGPSNASYTSAYGVGQYLNEAATDAVFRGGSCVDTTAAGVFAFQSNTLPSYSGVYVGFRCGK